MYNPTEEAFYEALANNGVTVTIKGNNRKAIFKTNKNIASNKNKEPYMTIFTKRDTNEPNISQGDVILFDNKQYLALLDNTNENTAYDKTYLVECNQIIKYELRHKGNASLADLTEFYANADNLSSSVNITQDISVLQSVCHFTFPLNDLTRRMLINDRFFAGINQIAWKIRDINYQNGFCEVYCVRSPLTSNDDALNMIADRWLFEHKADTYEVKLTPNLVSINVGDTQQLAVSVFKNGTEIIPTPKITYKISNVSICSVDPVTNIMTGLSDGTATIEGSYKVEDTDVVNSAVVSATIKAKPIETNIVINPPYDYSNYFELLQTTDQTFTATIPGVLNPQWNITFNSNGTNTSKYTYTINNSAGTFYVNNTGGVQSNKIIFNVSESTSGKSLSYQIKLAALF